MNRTRVNCAAFRFNSDQSSISIPPPKLSENLWFSEGVKMEPWQIGKYLLI